MKETIRTQERLPVARSQGGRPPRRNGPKTVLVKNLNPVRNLRGGCSCSEQRVKSFQSLCACLSMFRFKVAYQ